MVRACLMAVVRLTMESEVDRNNRKMAGRHPSDPIFFRSPPIQGSIILSVMPLTETKP